MSVCDLEGKQLELSMPNHRHISRSSLVACIDPEVKGLRSRGSCVDVGLCVERFANIDVVVNSASVASEVERPMCLCELRLVNHGPLLSSSLRRRPSG